MSRTITPPNRVEYRTNHLAMGAEGADTVSRVDGRKVKVMAWSGRVSEARLADWRRTYNESFKLGGVNAHLSNGPAGIPHICFARIVRQSDNVVLAEVQAPAFEVV